jgi:glycosyltransferase involved in cell wall biosynthesis
MPSDNSISIIVSTLNEADHIEATVAEVIKAATAHFDEHRIILIDDGSTDGTAVVADRIGRANENVMVVHHDRPHGLGGVYKKGLALANTHYVTEVNGKNDTTADQLATIWALKGQADMIIPYTLNPEERARHRRVISAVFTRTLNLLFGVKLRYFNHYVLHKRSCLESIRIRTDSYAFQAEILLKLIKRGHSYMEVGHRDKFDHEGASKAFRPRNLLGVAEFLLCTLYELHCTKRYVTYDPLVGNPNRRG